MSSLIKLSKSDIYMIFALTVGAIISIIIFIILNRSFCGIFWIIVYLLSTVIYTIAGMKHLHIKLKKHIYIKFKYICIQVFIANKSINIFIANKSIQIFIANKSIQIFM